MINTSLLKLNLATAFFVLPLFASYSIEMRDAPVTDALRLLASVQERNLVGPETIEGTITTSFPKIELEEALRSILASKHLGLLEDKHVSQVISQKTIEELGQDLATKTYTLKHSKAADMKVQLTPLLSPRGSAMVDERTNSLSIRDALTNLENVAHMIERIDRADRQVLIEARIVEATTDFARNLGIEWGLSYSGPGISVNRARPEGPDGGALGLKPIPSLSLDIALSAGETDGKANIISRPSIVTMNNQPATIRSGIKFFVKTPGSVNIGTPESPTQASTSNNLREIASGIALVVTPQITADDKITLVVNVSESQPDIAKGIEGVPAIIDNSATTTVSLKDGETTVIGGLFHAQDSSRGEGMPFFRSIPIIGPLLFGTQGQVKIKRELLIFIKPSIVRNNATADVLLEYQGINEKKTEKEDSPPKP